MNNSQLQLSNLQSLFQIEVTILFDSLGNKCRIFFNFSLHFPKLKRRYIREETNFVFHLNLFQVKLFNVLKYNEFHGKLYSFVIIYFVF